MDKEVKGLKEDMFKMVWFMRGGVTYSEISQMSGPEREHDGQTYQRKLRNCKEDRTTVLVIDQVKADIEQWLINFVEVPHPALGNWAPCPYARRARKLNQYDVRLGDDLERDMFCLQESNTWARMM